MLFCSPQVLIKPSNNKHLRNSIALCVLLAPIYLLANDHFSSWSDKTICRLAKTTPDNVEYQAESTSRGLSCGGSNTANSRASSKKVAKALAGIDIENDPNIDFFKPPLKPYPTDSMYWWGRKWQLADYNNDGFIDVLYLGVMRVSNFIRFNMNSDLPGDGEVECGDGDKCKGEKPLPSLFLGDADGNLTYSPHLLIDNSEIPGMSLGGQLLVADYNNDDTLDFYINDNGIEDFEGERDSYFLSQPDGTWLESSNTHFSHPNFESYNHGGATGDIDNDGDMDVVYTVMNDWGIGTEFWCLINDGTGFLTKRKCGGTFSFGLELADMDGDGDLDALVGAHEKEYLSNPSASNAITGIVWNDGRGNFNKHNNTSLPQHKQKFSVIPEVTASDLDNDGDLDIVYGRVNTEYKYPGIQIIENLGNKKFKDHGVISLNEAQGHIFDVKFRDFDGDGDNDVYLVSEGDNDVNTGTVLLNNGNFNFDIVRPDEALTLYTDGSNKKIIIGREKYIATDEEQAVLDELAEFEASLENEPADFDAAIVKRKEKVALAKAKRIAEETAKAAETNTFDTGQSVEDEIATFEAELAE